jgi:hypothetical protein
LFLSLLKSRAASNAPFFVYIMCFGGKEREGKGENKGILNLEGGFQFQRSLTRSCFVEPFRVNALALRASKLLVLVTSRNILQLKGDVGTNWRSKLACGEVMRELILGGESKSCACALAEA